MRAGDPRSSLLSKLTMATAAIGLFLISYYWGNQYKQQDLAPPALAGVLVRPPYEIPELELRDATGQPFTAESFAGHWTLLSFAEQSQGHHMVARLIEVRNRLASDPDIQDMLLLALASEHQDSTLARNVGRLTPALKVLSGDTGEMQRLRASLGAPAQEPTRIQTDEIPFYLIGPSKRLMALFTGTQKPASIASDLSTIAAHADALYPYPTDE